eukprot:g14118.t1
MCKRGFGSWAQLLAHQPMHEGERALECALCKQLFVAPPGDGQGALPGQDPYRCPLCKGRLACFDIGGFGLGPDPLSFEVCLQGSWQGLEGDRALGELCDQGALTHPATWGGGS